MNLDHSKALILKRAIEEVAGFLEDFDDQLVAGNSPRFLLGELDEITLRLLHVQYDLERIEQL